MACEFSSTFPCLAGPLPNLSYAPQVEFASSLVIVFLSRSTSRPRWMAAAIAHPARRCGRSPETCSLEPEPRIFFSSTRAPHLHSLSSKVEAAHSRGIDHNASSGKKEHFPEWGVLSASSRSSTGCTRRPVLASPLMIGGLAHAGRTDNAAVFPQADSPEPFSRPVLSSALSKCTEFPCNTLHFCGVGRSVRQRSTFVERTTGRAPLSQTMAR